MYCATCSISLPGFDPNNVRSAAGDVAVLYLGLSAIHPVPQRLRDLQSAIACLAHAFDEHRDASVTPPHAARLTSSSTSPSRK